MPIDPRLTSTEPDFETSVGSGQLEALPVCVEDAIADDAAEIITEILCSISAVKTL